MSLKDTDLLETRFTRSLAVAERSRTRAGTRRPAFSARAVTQTYAGLELLAVFAAGIAIGHGHLYDPLGEAALLDIYVWPSILTVVLLAYLNLRSGLYGMERLSRFATCSGAAIGNLLLSFGAIALVGLAVGTDEAFPHMWFGLWLATSAVLVLTARALAARVLASPSVKGAISRRVAVFGTGGPLRKATAALGGADSGTRLSGVFGPEPLDGEDASERRDGGLAELIDHAHSHQLDTVVIALPLSQHRHVPDVVAALGGLPTEIKLMADIGEQAVPLHGVSSLARVQCIDLQQKPLSGWGRFLKAAEDYTIAALATALLLPLLLIVAAAIKLDSPGPVIFRQRRHGLNNRVITVFKFRTMHVLPENEPFRQATRNDDRVTRIGRFLRRTSIDELPQLFNVLRGDMSIVGPRPHAVEMNAAYAKALPLYNTRHRVKPGITGWAQVNDFRGPTLTLDDMRKRLDHDLYYIENWSLMFDLSIIAATPFIGLTHKNAV